MKEYKKIVREEYEKILGKKMKTVNEEGQELWGGILDMFQENNGGMVKRNITGRTLKQSIDTITWGVEERGSGNILRWSKTCRLITRTNGSLSITLTATTVVRLDVHLLWSVSYSSSYFASFYKNTWNFLLWNLENTYNTVIKQWQIYCIRMACCFILDQ